MAVLLILCQISKAKWWDCQGCIAECLCTKQHWFTSGSRMLSKLGHSSGFCRWKFTYLTSLRQRLQHIKASSSFVQILFCAKPLAKKVSRNSWRSYVKRPVEFPINLTRRYFNCPTVGCRTCSLFLVGGGKIYKENSLLKPKRYILSYSKIDYHGLPSSIGSSAFWIEESLLSFETANKPYWAEKFPEIMLFVR